MTKIAYLGLISLATALSFACGDDDPVTPSGTGGMAGAGGDGGTGGTASDGGMGGTAADGGSGGDGGTGGTAADGGSGGGGMTASDCTGCASLLTPQAAAGDQTDFEINWGDAGLVDLSNTIVTIRAKVVTGTNGAIQGYAKNGAGQGFDGLFAGYTLYAAANDFVDVVIDMTDCILPVIVPDADAGVADAGAPVDAVDADAAVRATACGTNGFDAREVQFIGLQVLTAGTDGPFEDATVYVDSITFSTAAPAAIEFTNDVEGLAVNTFTSPSEGSTVTHIAP